MRPATATDKRQRAVYNIFKDALGIGKKATAEEIAVIDDAIEKLRDGSMKMELSAPKGAFSCLTAYGTMEKATVEKLRT